MLLMGLVKRVTGGGRWERLRLPAARGDAVMAQASEATGSNWEESVAEVWETAGPRVRPGMRNRLVGPSLPGMRLDLRLWEKGRSHSMEVAEVWESPGGPGPGMRNRLVGPILPG